MSEFKHCPFCGGERVRRNRRDDRFFQMCSKCGARSEDGEWNTRPIEDALNKRIAELENAMRDINRIAMDSMERSEHMQTIYGYSVAAMRNRRK